jgi:hypothetical protein
MNWDKLLVIGRDRDSFKALVGRKIRERRQDERQLAEHRATKHQLQARNSCVADARSYRVARRLPVPAAARSHWKALIPLKRFNKIRSVAQEISRLAIPALADQPILRALFKSAQTDKATAPKAFARHGG